MNQEHQALFDEAHALQREGQLPQAITLYEQLLNLEPQQTQVLHFLGLANAQLGDLITAIRYLEQAVLLEPNNPGLHNNLGNAYKKSHQIDQAIQHYQEAIRLLPDYAQAHHNLATIFTLQNEYQQALNHYRLALHAAPDFTDAHFNLGLLLLKNNKLQAAKTQFNNVLSLNPNHLETQFYLGVLNLEAGQLAEAEEAFQNVLKKNEHHVHALTNLGVLALKREQGQVAVHYFTQALALDNNHLDARNNLAATFMHYDRFENALMHYDVLLQHDPNHIEYLYNSGVAQMALGHLNEAIHYFECILTQQSDHFAALNNLAAIYLRLEEREKARTLLERALAANPEDAPSRHMLDALSGQASSAETCTPYATNLFNNYALYYDQHMQGPLHYTLPHHIARIIHQLPNHQMNEVIDLGCGTGLSGIVLRERAKHLVGVDISVKMLAEAKKKNLYDQLIESELLTYLKQDVHYYELIVAADIFPYFGDLDPLFAAIAQRLHQPGYFIFSTEISENKDWQLQISARFSHHPDYIQALCKKHGFHLYSQEPVIARQHHQQGLAVMIYVLQK